MEKATRLPTKTNFFERRVAVALQGLYGSSSELMDWGRHYLLRERDLWVTRMALDKLSGERLVRWDPSGVLVHLSHPSMMDSLRKLSCPVVNLSGLLAPRYPFPTVTLDNPATGALAAEFLWEKGFRRFAFMGYPDEHGVSRLRYDGFVGDLSRKGVVDVPCYKEWIPELGLRTLEEVKKAGETVVNWVDGLEGGTALFVPDDDVASHLVRYLQVFGLDPFQTCAIFSGHHLEATTHIGISGILQPVRPWAARAVKELVSLMEGGEAPREPVLLPPDGVIEMESTVGFSVEDPAVSAAQRFILRHLYANINVKDVVEANPMSRRSLEMKFSQFLGHSILDEIQLRRVRQAEHLLLHSTLSLEEVALGAGFSDQKHLQRVFKTVVGETPGAYRRVRVRKREEG